jgi:hypothetical protein
LARSDGCDSLAASIRHDILRGFLSPVVTRVGGQPPCPRPRRDCLCRGRRACPGPLPGPCERSRAACRVGLATRQAGCRRNAQPEARQRRDTGYGEGRSPTLRWRSSLLALRPEGG